MHRWRPENTPYEEWFVLSGTERQHRRAELKALRPDMAASGESNYEAHHPPLAYAPLSLIDSSISESPITSRILVLRLFAAISSAVLVFFGGVALGRELELLFYATTAHIANDWLAVPLATWCFAAVAAYINKPDLRRSLPAAVWLALGLLTKAYFLAFAFWAAMIAALVMWLGHSKHKPVLIGAALVAAVAGPWYARNLVVYGNVSGTYEAFTGIGIKEAFAAVPGINWPATVSILARGSLWMGNNSGTSFSRTTLSIVLFLLVLGMTAWASRRSLIRPAERTVFAGIAVFILAMAYAACSAFACRDCSFREASPWYTQVLLVPVLALAYLGMSRWRRVGVGIAISTVALWTWVLLATWIIKLFPMYSGGGSAPMHFSDVWDWYAYRATTEASAFSLTALAPAPVLYAGLLVSIGLAVTLSISVVSGIIESRPRRRGNN